MVIVQSEEAEQHKEGAETFAAKSETVKECLKEESMTIRNLLYSTKEEVRQLRKS